MLPNAQPTSHSRMSGSSWVTTPLWLSRSLIPLLYSSSVYSCHLFLISSASVTSLPFLSFIEPIFAWNAPLVTPIFLNRSLGFPSLLFSSISLHCSHKKAFLSLLSILLNATFSQLGIFSPFSFAFQFSSFLSYLQGLLRPLCLLSFPLRWFWSTPPVPGGSDYDKESACNGGDPGLIPESGKSPGEGNGYLLQYLAWQIPWTVKLVDYNPWGRRVRHDWATNTSKIIKTDKTTN